MSVSLAGGDVCHFQIETFMARRSDGVPFLLWG